MGSRDKTGSDFETTNPWQTLSSRPIYDNPWISVREDAVIRPDGKTGIYGVVHYKNTAIGVVAVEDNYIYLVGQYRYPLDRYSWETPEGGGAGDEDPLEAAKRELREETGIEASQWMKLGEAHLSNSVSDERAIWYLASGLKPGRHSPEGSEQLIVRRVPFDDALRWALTGEITDALSLLGIMQYEIFRRSGAGDIAEEKSEGPAIIDHRSSD